MKKLVLTTAVGFSALFATAQAPDTLRGHITTNTTLSASTAYILMGYVYVDSLRTLTIPAGTVIYGDKVSKGTLIIKRGAKIRSLGTQSNPVVFTSAKPIGSRATGDWGGIVIAGNAKANNGVNIMLEGGTAGASSTNPTGYEVWYGGDGTRDNESSGKIAFTRIEYAGIALFPNQEINGLTMAGVGAGTIIHHVQVSYGGDDSFEWFGGKVNSRYIIAYKGVDDDFDCDFGYSGANQWGLGIKDKNIADASTSNGFEIDNDGTGSTNTPKTKPIFTNFTMIGPRQYDTTVINSLHGRGAHLRRNCEPKIFNTIWTGYKTGILIDGSTTGANANANLLKIKNCVVAAVGTTDVEFSETGGSALSPSVSGWFANKKDSIYGTLNDLKLRFPYTIPPDARLKCVSWLRYGSDTTDATLLATSHIDYNETYRGAFDCAYDWLTQWTEFDPQNFNYCAGCPTRMMGENETSVVTANTKMDVYPNPVVNGQATVTFELEETEVEGGMTGSAVIHIYDITGKEVLTSVPVDIIAGYNQLNIDASTLTQGMYLVKIEAGNTFRTARIIVGSGN